MDKIELIEQAIRKADNLESKLTDGVIAIGGFTSNRIRHLLNNLGGICNNYFEIGSHRGSTFCSTIFGNYNIETAIAVDNFTECYNNEDPKTELLSNMEKFRGNTTVALIEKDCFGIPSLPFKPDLYLYDGDHSDWAQAQALTHFYYMLPDEFIFCVDDSNWEQVKKGTAEGIAECKFDVLFDMFLFDGKEGGIWWNGFSVYLLKKKA